MPDSGGTQFHTLNMASAQPELAASTWFAGERRRAVRSGAIKVEFSERVSCYTTTRTVTAWYRSGRTEPERPSLSAWICTQT